MNKGRMFIAHLICLNLFVIFPLCFSHFAGSTFDGTPLPLGHNVNWKALCKAHKPGIGFAGAPGKIYVDLELPLSIVGIPSNLLFKLNFDRKRGFSCFKLGAITRTEIDKVLVTAVEFDKEKDGKKFSCRADMQWEKEDGIFEMPMKEIVKWNAKKLGDFVRRRIYSGKGDAIGEMEKHLDKSSILEGINEEGEEIGEKKIEENKNIKKEEEILNGEMNKIDDLKGEIKRKKQKLNGEKNKNKSRMQPMQAFGRTNLERIEQRKGTIMGRDENENRARYSNIREIFGQSKLGEKNKMGKYSNGNKGKEVMRNELNEKGDKGIGGPMKELVKEMLKAASQLKAEGRISMEEFDSDEVAESVLDSLQKNGKFSTLMEKILEKGILEGEMRNCSRKTES